jgi:uncharacterized membrane protein YhaH (DUF805 family)
MSVEERTLLRSPTTTRPAPLRFASFVGVLAGIAYLSWPLAYALNRSVVERGLASDLEVPGQPYNWLFIGLDIVSGLFMVALAVLAWQGAEHRPGRTGGGLLGYGLFGLSSILDAAVPLSCGHGRAALLACGTDAGTYGVHDFVSVLGYLAFFGSLVGAMVRPWRDGSPRWWATSIVLTGVAWAVAGLAFLAITLSQDSEVTSQHVLLLLTSLVIALVPFTIHWRGPQRTNQPSG